MNWKANQVLNHNLKIPLEKKCSALEGGKADFHIRTRLMTTLVLKRFQINGAKITNAKSTNFNLLTVTFRLSRQT